MADDEPPSQAGPRTPSRALEVSLLAAIVGIAVTDAWLLVAELQRAGVIAAVGRGQLLAPSTAAALDHRVQVAARLDLVLRGATALLFITWLYGMAKVVAHRRPDALRRGPGWAIGGWFVPVGQLVLPKQTVDDVWLGSGGLLERRSPPWFVHAWWGCFVIGALVRLVVPSAPGAGTAVFADHAGAAAAGFGSVAAMLAVAVVVSISRRIRGRRSQDVAFEADPTERTGHRLPRWWAPAAVPAIVAVTAVAAISTAPSTDDGVAAVAGTGPPASAGAPAPSFGPHARRPTAAVLPASGAGGLDGPARRHEADGEGHQQHLPRPGRHARAARAL